MPGTQFSQAHNIKFYARELSLSLLSIAEREKDSCLERKGSDGARDEGGRFGW